MSGSNSTYVPIVVVNVSQQQAPTPSTLQRSGAFVSQGATTLPAGTWTLLAAPSSLAPLLTGAQALTSLAWAASVGTATTAQPHGLTVGDIVPITISGAAPVGWNGARYQGMVTGASTITFPTTTNPGTETTPGFLTLEDVSELTSMNTTFWAQGAATPVYVLELGPGNATDGITALQAFITANPKTFYSYLLPRYWGMEPTTYSTLAKNYNGTTAKTYFHITTTLAFWQANSTLFASTLKSALVSIEAPAVAGSNEFSAAARFWVTLSQNPSSSQQVTQLAFSYVYGVTAYPQMGNSALFAQLKAANIGIIGTGAEGGVPNTILLYGRTLDGNDFNKYWYAIDWMQINLDLATANAIINGSNNPLAPLNNNQQGINTLQAVGGGVAQSAIAFGLALGTLVLTQMTGTDFAAAILAGQFAGKVVLNAVPFASYNTLSPGDYSIGKYAGLGVAYAVQLGFDQIIYNVEVANFV